MNESDIYAGLNEIFADVFLDDGIVLTPATTAKDIDGWDSFNHINIVLASEMRFGVKFKTSEVESVRNIGDFVRMIQEKQNVKA